MYVCECQTAWPHLLQEINRMELRVKEQHQSVLSSSVVPNASFKTKLAASLLRLCFLLITSRFEGAGTQSVVERHAV